MTDETSFANEEEEEAIEVRRRLTDVANNTSCIVHIYNGKCLRYAAVCDVTCHVVLQCILYRMFEPFVTARGNMLGNEANNDFSYDSQPANIVIAAYKSAMNAKFYLLK